MILKSWLGEKPTRRRTKKAQISDEEMSEMALKLQQSLGRIPTTGEVFYDTFCALTSDMARKGLKKFNKEGTYHFIHRWRGEPALISFFAVEASKGAEGVYH